MSASNQQPIPRRALPSFKKVLRPGSSQYTAPELGKLEKREDKPRVKPEVEEPGKDANKGNTTTKVVNDTTKAANPNVPRVTIVDTPDNAPNQRKAARDTLGMPRSPAKDQAPKELHRKSKNAELPSDPDPFRSSAVPIDLMGALSMGGKYANIVKDADLTVSSSSSSAGTGKSSHQQMKVFQLKESGKTHQKPQFKQIVNTAAPASKGKTIEAVKKEILKFDDDNDTKKLDDDDDDDDEEDTDAEGEEDTAKEGKEDKDGKTAKKTKSSDPLVIPGLVPTLMAHQKTGVKFLLKRERARKYARGGLLADAMGLGKTIQSISLILAGAADPAKLIEQNSVKSTLVIVPLAVMDQWIDEIRIMAPKLVVTKHYGAQRTYNINDFVDSDVVITTYHTISSDVSMDGPVCQTVWWRIIADEAHTFRNPQTKISGAMMALHTLENSRRWVLTGTPIHNSVEDLHTLLTFIGVTRTGESELPAVLNAVMLRRSQKVLSKVLPDIVMKRQAVPFLGEEAARYNEIDPSAGGFLGAIVRMRLACDSIFRPKTQVIPKSPIHSAAESRPEWARDEAGIKQEEDALRNGAVNEDDLLSSLLGGMSLTTNVTSDDSFYEFPSDENSKVTALRGILNVDRKRKTVVFSSFTIMLRQIRPMLQDEGLDFELYDGSLPADRRVEVLKRFKDETKNVTVLLCSLHAGAVGLNLAFASQVVVMDPWWNPQIVDQAIKRVHRLGQKNVVQCIELYRPDALDERMIVLQDAKRVMAKNMLDGHEKLTTEEREFLLYG